MLAESYPYYLANRPEQPNTELEVRDKYRGTIANLPVPATVLSTTQPMVTNMPPAAHAAKTDSSQMPGTTAASAFRRIGCTINDNKENSLLLCAFDAAGTRNRMKRLARRA